MFLGCFFFLIKMKYVKIVYVFQIVRNIVVIYCIVQKLYENQIRICDGINCVGLFVGWVR